MYFCWNQKKTNKDLFSMIVRSYSFSICKMKFIWSKLGVPKLVQLEETVNQNGLGPRECESHRNKQVKELIIIPVQKKYVEGSRQLCDETI